MASARTLRSLDANQCHRCSGLADTEAVWTLLRGGRIVCTTRPPSWRWVCGGGAGGDVRCGARSPVVDAGHPGSAAAAVIAGWHIAGWHGVTRRGLARVVAGLIVLVALVAPVLHVLAHRPGALLVVTGEDFRRSKAARWPLSATGCSVLWRNTEMPVRGCAAAGRSGHGYAATRRDLGHVCYLLSSSACPPRLVLTGRVTARLRGWSKRRASAPRPGSCWPSRSW